MASYAVGDIAVVTLKGSLGGQITLNTFGYRVTAATNPNNTQSVNDQLFVLLRTTSQFVTDYLRITPDNYVLSEIWIQRVRNGRLAKNVYLVDAPGTNEANANVPNVAVTITKRGPEANRRNIGSVHIPVSPNADGIVEGVVGGDIRDRMDAFGSSMTLVFTTANGPVTFEPCIVNTTAQFPSPLYTETISQDTSRVTRRRTVRLGI